MAKIGRPTKYTEDMPKLVFDFMANGGSITQFAAHIGIARSKIYEWAKRHPDFGDALERAREASEAYWEKELQGMMYTREVNAPLVKLYMANRFGWHDKAEVDNRSSDGSMSPPSRIEIVAPSVKDDSG